MKIEVSEKAAPVPESTERIGFASATTLAEAGASVVLNGRDKAKVEAAARKLEGCFHTSVAAVPLFVRTAGFLDFRRCDSCVGTTGAGRYMPFIDAVRFRMHSNIVLGAPENGAPPSKPNLVASGVRH
jgi:hypothetical protein